MSKATPIISHIAPRDIARAVMTAEDAQEFNLGNLSELRAIGLGLDAANIRKMAVALDAAPDMVNGGAANGVYINFLRNILPGVVGTMTAARKIDEFVGMTTAGAWSDEEVVQETMSPVGLAQPYTDKGNIPLASYDFGYEARGVVRFELGFEMNKLESDRAARMRSNAAQRKRTSVSNALNIQRNLVGFFGYNGAESPIYGFLNDPTLPAYASVAATGAGGLTTWASKDFMAMTGDIREAVGALQAKMKGNFDPRKAAWTLGIPTAQASFLTVTNVQGSLTVESWFKQTYPNARIVDAPELEGVNGGASVFYVYPDRVEGEDDGSDDNGRVFDQIVQTLFSQIGVEQRAKGYTEAFTNATSGVLTKRPFAVERRTGI